MAIAFIPPFTTEQQKLIQEGNQLGGKLSEYTSNFSKLSFRERWHACEQIHEITAQYNELQEKIEAAPPPPGVRSFSFSDLTILPFHDLYKAQEKANEIWDEIHAFNLKRGMMEKENLPVIAQLEGEWETTYHQPLVGRTGEFDTFLPFFEKLRKTSNEHPDLLEKNIAFIKLYDKVYILIKNAMTEHKKNPFKVSKSDILRESKAMTRSLADVIERTRPTF